MQITITAKLQVLVSSEQRELLDATMNAYSNACNCVANYIFQTHDLKQFSLNKALYYDLRKRFGLKSQMAQSVFKTVIARYKAILENQQNGLSRISRTLSMTLFGTETTHLQGSCFP